MAIEKMKLLSLVGAKEEEHAILQELVLCQKVHINLEDHEANGNNYLMHEYEAMLPSAEKTLDNNDTFLESTCQQIISEMEKTAEDLNLQLNIVLEDIKTYSRDRALEDLRLIEDRIRPNITAIIEKRHQIQQIEELEKNIGYINQSIDFDQLKALQYIRYEIGRLSRDNRLHIKKNYENISELIFEIGTVEDSKEDIYIVFYLTSLEDETQRLLKSLNWHKLELGNELSGDVKRCQELNRKKLEIIRKQISILERDMFGTSSDIVYKLSKVYTRMKLELKIMEMKQCLFSGNNVFVLTAWIRARDYRRLEESISGVTDKYIMMARNPNDLSTGTTPPTQLKNNWFCRPFELIVKLYGLPSYNEMDPTPFLAITFCLMFGIMFGDVGQGFVYFLAGCLLVSKIPAAAGVLKRLGMSSMVFGLVYGSVFGLEDIPILKDIALVHGGPLNTNNIMPILVMGVVFGVVVLSVSFFIGIINALRRQDIESAFFGKNGIAGYIFFMGLVCSVLCILGVVPIAVKVPVLTMILMLILMVFKEPLTHLIEGKRPLIKGDKGSYYIESGFEGVETILSTLSNFISFIRVGAFALNHAGLFMAFTVMASMVPNIIGKVMILILGNILILVLEGLVVFIQGLRLQYYEMFSKYFEGDGLAYEPVKVEK